MSRFKCTGFPAHQLVNPSEDIDRAEKHIYHGDDPNCYHCFYMVCSVTREAIIEHFEEKELRIRSQIGTIASMAFLALVQGGIRDPDAPIPRLRAFYLMSKKEDADIREQRWLWRQTTAMQRAKIARK